MEGTRTAWGAVHTVLYGARRQRVASGSGSYLHPPPWCLVLHVLPKVVCLSLPLLSSSFSSWPPQCLSVSHCTFLDSPCSYPHLCTTDGVFALTWSWQEEPIHVVSQRSNNLRHRHARGRGASPSPGLPLQFRRTRRARFRDAGTVPWDNWPHRRPLLGLVRVDWDVAAQTTCERNLDLYFVVRGLIWKLLATHVFADEVVPSLAPGRPAAKAATQARAATANAREAGAAAHFLVFFPFTSFFLVFQDVGRWLHLRHAAADKGEEECA